MSNSLYPDQDQPFVGPDVGPKLFAKVISSQQKSPLARKVLNCSHLIFWAIGLANGEGPDQTALWAAPCSGFAQMSMLLYQVAHIRYLKHSENEMIK